MNKPFGLPAMDAGRFTPEAEKSFTLPAFWYTDPAIYRAEHEAIFYRTWIYQCHVSDVAKSGDYHVGRVADQSIFIIRDKGASCTPSTMCAATAPIRCCAVGATPR
jgi:hypothetical protein